MAKLKSAKTSGAVTNHRTSGPTRGQQSREQTRQKLIEAAVKVMSKKGVDGTAIADITDQADVGFGSFYNHFKSKTEIAQAAFTLHAQRLKAIIAQVGQKEPDRAVAVAYICRIFLTKATADPIWGSFVLHAAADLPGLWSEVFDELGVKHLREGIDAGRFRMRGERTAMRLIIAAIMATMRVLIEGAAEESARENTIECILRMLGISDSEAVELAKRGLPKYVLNMFSEEAAKH